MKLKKNVDRSSQEKLDQTTFRIVLLDIHGQFKSKMDLPLEKVSKITSASWTITF